VIYFFNFFFFFFLFKSGYSDQTRETRSPIASFILPFRNLKQNFLFFSSLLTQPGTTRRVEQPNPRQKRFASKRQHSTWRKSEPGVKPLTERTHFDLPHTQNREKIWISLDSRPSLCLFIPTVLILSHYSSPFRDTTSRCTILLRRADDTAILYRADNFDNDAKFKVPGKFNSRPSICFSGRIHKPQKTPKNVTNGHRSPFPVQATIVYE